MANLILPEAYSNLYAPPWRYPNFETRDVPLRWTYSGTFVIPLGTTILNNSIPINGSSDFLAREFAFHVETAPGGTAITPGDITVRFKSSTGKRLSADLLAIEELEGPMPVSLLCPHSTQLLVDIQNASTTTDFTVQVILKGIQIFQPLGINRCMPGFEPERYTPMYDYYSVPPAGWHDEPFDYFFPLTLASGARKVNVLPMNGDADFYWRGTVGQNGVLAGLQAIKFYDAFQNQLNTKSVFQANALGLAPFAKPMYPEVCCPAYSVLTADCQEYVGHDASLNLVLRGVKRFKD